MTDPGDSRHHSSMGPVAPAEIAHSPESPPCPPSFEQLYDEHVSFVWRTLRRLGVVPSQLEDAVQEVFIVVHRRLAEFDGRAPRAWLGAIARRVASDARRAARRVATEDLAEEHGASLAPPAGPSSEEDSRLLLELMRCLDQEKREVFVLAELEEMTMPEVAQALDINLNTAYSRLRAARRTLLAAHARLVAAARWRRG